jgi:acyl carrier protein
VKIRGHRIELGEIEAALEAHPRVRDAVVVAAGRPPRTLGAFVVPSEPGAAVAGLTPFLAERLPSHMLPDRIHQLDAVPLTANGKVDRAELARLDAGLEDSADGAGGVEPDGQLERALADLWCELLDVPGVGRRTSFFALGGDSLVATRLVEAIRRRFGVESSLRELYAAPTIEQLALRVGQVSAGAFDEGVV